MSMEVLERANGNYRPSAAHRPLPFDGAGQPQPDVAAQALGRAPEDANRGAIAEAGPHHRYAAAVEGDPGVRRTFTREPDQRSRGVRDPRGAPLLLHAEIL